MSTIKIGNDERSLGQADAQWITQEINGGRQPTNREQAVLDLWHKHKLNDADFSPGGVVAFVKQVSQFL